MNAHSSRWMSWAVVTLVGVTGLLVGIPQPMVGQTNAPQSPSQSAELEEAKRLNEQVVQLYNQGKYSEAIALAQRALAINEKVLGLEHPSVATSLNNLAGLYSDQGNYTQALLLYQRALAIREQVLGLEHPDVAQSLNNLASLYLAQGDITRAIEFQNRVNNIEEHNLALMLTTGSEAQKRAYTATLSGTTDATVFLQSKPHPTIPKPPVLPLPQFCNAKAGYLML